MAIIRERLCSSKFALYHLLQLMKMSSLFVSIFRKRTFYHSHTYMPMSVEEVYHGDDSDDDENDEWILRLNEKVGLLLPTVCRRVSPSLLHLQSFPLQSRAVAVVTN